MVKKRRKAVSWAKRHRKAASHEARPREHVRKISYDYEKRAKHLNVNVFKREEKSTHPLGIKVLIGYLVIILGFYFFYLFLGMKSPLAIVFGQIIGGMPALLIVLCLMAFTMVLIAGLVKRKRWGYYLSLIWFSFGILNSLISLILLKPEVASFTRNFLILSSVTIFVIDILAILYIASEKNYFFASHFIQKKAAIVDKLFVVALIVFLVITISIGSAMGYDFYRKNIQQTDSMIGELDKKTYDQQISICNSKADSDKDLCLLIVSIKNQEKKLKGWEDFISKNPGRVKSGH